MTLHNNTRAIHPECRTLFIVTLSVVAPCVAYYGTELITAVVCFIVQSVITFEIRHTKINIDRTKFLRTVL
jgi:hypothetical protein